MQTDTIIAKIYEADAETFGAIAVAVIFRLGDLGLEGLEGIRSAAVAQNAQGQPEWDEGIIQLGNL